jgi:hypothetical protein
MTGADMSLTEHAQRVMRGEADRRGLVVTFPGDVPGHIPEETRLWLCHVENKGWCYFTAPGFGDEITLPAEREFVPADEVLAGAWSLFYGQITLRGWPRSTSARARA